ncbi:hypothetical protein BKA70DRAFT_680129 [Coprinopsis sp. MPI-PUGE-AT-0042]|nr:hypothetical protein BKA70DRAFT_680129 [Coprinopsis sp. MPI-PUGE-AT-0042]
MPSGTKPPQPPSFTMEDVVAARPESLPSQPAPISVTSQAPGKPIVSQGSTRPNSPCFANSPSRSQALSQSHPITPISSGQHQLLFSLSSHPGQVPHGCASAEVTGRRTGESPLPTFMPSPLWNTPPLTSPLAFDAPMPFHTSSPPALARTPLSGSPASIVSPPGMASPNLGGSYRGHEELL